MKRVLHACRDCRSRDECPFEDAGQCPALRAELTSEGGARSKREKQFADMESFTSNAREVMPELQATLVKGVAAALASGEDVVQIAVRLMRIAGFSLRQVEDVCASGWSHTKVWRRTKEG